MMSYKLLIDGDNSNWKKCNGTKPKVLAIKHHAKGYPLIMDFFD